MRNQKQSFFIDFPIKKIACYNLLANEKLGVKGLNLIKITSDGIQSPPGFIISSEVSLKYKSKGFLDKKIQKDIKSHLNRIVGRENKNDEAFDKPVCFSVRPSPSISMPGVLDTILNVGLSKNLIVNGAHNERAYCCFLETFIESYRRKNPEIINSLSKIGNQKSYSLKIKKLEKIAKKFDISVPEESTNQIISSIFSIYDAWFLDHCKLNEGIAVVIQKMVFGDIDSNSLSGVVFTCNPVNQNKKIIGEYLFGSQNDVVSNKSNPKQLDILRKTHESIYNNIIKTAKKIERIFNYPQDIEFTVEKGKLFILQSRNIRFSNIDSSLISLSDMGNIKLIGTGVAASPGIVSGKVIFNPRQNVQNGESLILIKKEADSSCISNLHNLAGIVLGTGGTTSHLAVISRILGKVAIMGLKNMILVNNEECIIGEKTIKENDYITVNGLTGEVFQGRLESIVNQSCKSNITKTDVFMFSKSSGLKFLKKYGLAVPAIFYSPQKAKKLKIYSIRTSFPNNKNMGIKVGYYLPSAFNVPLMDLESSYNRVRREFFSKYKIIPDIIIHSTHQILFAGNLEIDKIAGTVTIEIWNNYQKTNLIFSKQFKLFAPIKYEDLSVTINIQDESKKLPFAHYLLEFIVTKSKKVLFMEVNVLKK